MNKNILLAILLLMACVQISTAQEATYSLAEKSPVSATKMLQNTHRSAVKLTVITLKTKPIIPR